MPVERLAGVTLPANCNLDEDHISPTMANADSCHDPRTNVRGGICNGP